MTAPFDEIARHLSWPQRDVSPASSLNSEIGGEPVLFLHEPSMLPFEERLLILNREENSDRIRLSVMEEIDREGVVNKYNTTHSRVKCLLRCELRQRWELMMSERRELVSLAYTAMESSDMALQPFYTKLLTPEGSRLVDPPIFSPSEEEQDSWKDASQSSLTIKRSINYGKLEDGLTEGSGEGLTDSLPKLDLFSDSEAEWCGGEQETVFTADSSEMSVEDRTPLDETLFLSF